MLIAEREHARHGGGVRRRDHGERMAAIQRAVIAQHGRDALGIGEHRGIVDQRTQLVQWIGEVVHARMIARGSASYLFAGSGRIRRG